MSRRPYTRASIERFRHAEAERMSADKELNRSAVELLVKSGEYHWIHQANWFGQPVLNPAQDMFARQEIIYRTRPDYIIELGVAWGGSLLFYASLMELLGGKKVIGVDTFIPADLTKRLLTYRRLSRRLHLINGSSTAPETFAQIRKVLGRSRRVLVILDSNHTHENVLAELQLYATLVGRGYYMICADTFLDDAPEGSRLTTDRPWGEGDNPRTALREFLRQDPRFAPDTTLGGKLLISCNPDGYLKRVR